MKKIILKIVDRFFCLIGLHESECGEIHEGTLNELSVWCKHCDRPL